MNIINGIVVKTSASDNTFLFNKIVNATESGILNVKRDSGTSVDNTFEHNKLINSKVNTTNTTSTFTTIAVDNDDESEKKKGKKKK